MKIKIIYTTTDSDKTAHHIAKLLVNNKLAKQLYFGSDLTI